MLKEISYCIYIFFLNLRKKEKWIRKEIVGPDAAITSAVLISLCLLSNAITIVCAAEYILNYKFLNLLLAPDKGSISSWLPVAVTIFPYLLTVWIVWHRYFGASSLKKLLKEYSGKSKSRIRYGRIFTVIYLLLSYVLFLTAAVLRNS